METSRINTYELTVIIAGNLTEAEALGTVDDIRAMIERGAGNIVAERPWGKRNLAYPMSKQTSGYYQTVVFNYPAEALSAFTLELRRLPNIIRQLLITFHPVPERPVESSNTASAPLEATPAEPVTIEERQEKLDEALAEILEDA